MVSKKEQDYFIGLGEKLGRRNALLEFKNIIDKSSNKTEAVEVAIGEYDKFISVHKLNQKIKKFGEKDG